MMTDDQQLILNALAKTSATETIQSSELFLSCVGMDLSRFTIATNALYESKKINKCFIGKDGIGQNFYWATGYKGVAKSLDPISTLTKNTDEQSEKKPKLTEPKSWTAIKKQSSATANSIESGSLSMKNKPSKTDVIKKMIDNQPGISFEELIFKLVGDTSDQIELRKASDMITYTIKRGGYTKKISPHNGTKRFYNNNSVNKDESPAIDAQIAAEIKPQQTQAALERHNNNVQKLLNDTLVDKSLNLDYVLTLPIKESMLDTAHGIGDVNSSELGSGARFNHGKADYSLIPFNTLEDEARVWQYGKEKYNAWNWTKGMAWSVPFACLMRHMAAWQLGEEFDKESGLPHLAHAMCNLRMLTLYKHVYPDGDDRPQGLLYAKS